MISFIQRHGGLIYPTVLIGTAMNIVASHASPLERAAFFVVALFPSVLIATTLSSLRAAKDAEDLARRRRSLAAKAHEVIWGKTLDHPDLRQADDPNGDWMRLLLAPSGSVIKVLADQLAGARVLRELSERTASHGSTLLHLHNLNLIPHADPTWFRINALAAALTEPDLNPKLVTDILTLVEQALSDAIPAPANLQQETA
ncbi:hypothetical protein Ccr2_gp163c [Caulobacter phage Ccr2]|nr:hypothetical protein Ccr10_gp164c [Caulobacter phage Ccr10]ARB14039.1 hypothetical protein Ccr2_gp163c [Caulobacter phage Ccr2]ARB14726.1 hypothetical protein Ccr29_gp170 [Caulobacter phage Ccr29]